MQCQLCNFESSSGKGLAYHIRTQHKMSSKDYYDRFYGPKYCNTCGKLTKFLGLSKGYTEYCSKKCYCSTEEFSNHMRTVANNCWTKDHTNRNLKISQTNKNKTNYIKSYLGYPLQELIQKYGEVWYVHKVVPIYYYKNFAYIKFDDESHIVDYLNNIKQFKSSYEYDIYKSISSYYTGEIYHNYKLDNHEVDIFLPELNLIVEYNGKYWHDFRANEQEKYAKYQQQYKVYFIEASNNYELFLNDLNNLKNYICNLDAI